MTLGIGVTAFSQEAQDSISGQVLQQSDLKPIPFAKIYFPDIEVGVVADVQGKFAYQGLLADSVRMEIKAMGYETKVLRLNHAEIHQYKILLQAQHLDLDEVLVTARTGVLERVNVSNVETRKMDELRPLPIQNLTDGISLIPGVYSQTQSTGIGKPVIRGLSGMRVVTYLNGQRIENQQWGADHGLGIASVGIGQVEVIKGPSSLLYGPDAMGGTLYLSDEPYAPVDQIQGEAQSMVESVDQSVQNSLSAKYSQHRFRVAVYGQQKNAADYQVPDGRFVANSRYKQNVWRMSVGVNRRAWLLNVRYSGLQNRLGLPGHSHESNPQAEDFLTVQQNRKNNIPAQVNDNHYLSLENTFHVRRGTVNLNLGHSLAQLTEYEEKFTVPAIDMALRNTTYNLRYRRDLLQHWQLLIGGQGMFQMNQNSKWSTEKLLPFSSMFDNGVYALAHFTKNAWSWQIGARADRREIRSFEAFNNSEPLVRTYQGLNFSTGFSRESKSFIWRGAVSSGFRPPHLSELLAFGVHHGGNRFEIGSTNLMSERATQLDVSLEYRNEHVQFKVNPFVSIYNDLIGLTNTGLMAGIYPVYGYVQSKQLSMYGVDISMHYHPHFLHHLHVDLNASVLSQNQERSPISFIPPGRIQSLFTYHLSEKKKGFVFHAITLQHRFFASQNLVAEFETPSNTYQLVNAGMQMKWIGQQELIMEFGGRNLLNVQYVDHLSNLKSLGLPGAGRSVYVQIKWAMKTKVKHKNH